MASAAGPTPKDQDIRSQLQRLLDHPDFASTPQRRAFLNYVVDETLAGRTKQIKGISIAMSVFGRDEDFDQQIDPIVRLEARRLRQDIDSYYAGPGRNDPIRITIPKGSYVPRFEHDETLQEADSATQQKTTTPVQSHQRIRLILGAVGILVMIAGLGLFLFQAQYNAPATVSSTLPKGPVIAVLPFASFGDGPSYVADGITQQVTTELIKFDDLWVLPLGSVARFRNTQTEFKVLRDEFNADFVLEGAVRNTGHGLNISARLVDLTTERYVWVRSYDTTSSPEEVYKAQDEITREVIGNLAGKYGVFSKEAMKAATRIPPNNRSAYECVLEYYSYQISIDLTRHAEVKACIEQAVQSEPDYADAWVVLSNLYMQQIRFALGGNEQEIFKSAEEAARRAVELNPHSAGGHLMLANVRFSLGDLAGFRKSGATAIELNSNDNAVLAHYGLRLTLSGSWDEGLAIMDKAIALNPAHPHWYYFPRVFYLYDQGEFQHAFEVLDEIEMPGFFWTHLWQAVLNEELGDHEAADSAVRQLLRLRPDFALEAQTILSIWQLEEEYKETLMRSLDKAGLNSIR
ncbi:tetratricopeptide repeat protein [Roseovarius sp. EL26]|uniref:tetratricopeptide repeat protein n=1 Tax=Roseovarius sp. EL26 TaxID=2126672 RepID=UPI0013C4B77A|nr:tetratricopeptide repeat protein [Roseovarius sp. EL26]